MPAYELMFILQPELDEEQVNTATDRVHQLVVQNGGSVTKTASWGKRRLAYAVGQNREGYYVVSNFTVDADKISEIERVLKISDTVFRHLLLRRDRPLASDSEVFVPEATPEELAEYFEAPEALAENDQAAVVQVEGAPAPIEEAAIVSDEAEEGQS